MLECPGCWKLQPAPSKGHQGTFHCIACGEAYRWETNAQGEQVAARLSPQERLNRLQGRDDRCHPECKGWAVFNEEDTEPDLQVCDDCWAGHEDPITDEDLMDLAEPRAALDEAIDRSERTWSVV